MDGDQSDVSSWLIDASKQANNLEQDRHWLNGDAITIVIAGRYVIRHISKASLKSILATL